MGLQLTVPTNSELDLVIQEYTNKPDEFIGATILPDEDHYTQKVRWDEKDTDRGMTAPHTMDADPKIDKRPGHKTREYEPGAFKETDVIKESEMLRARELGTMSGVIDLGRTVAEISQERMNKTKTRVEWLRWQTLQGSLTIDENGVKISETFPIQTYDAEDGWDTHADATPIKDFNAVALKFRATGASAQGAKAYMNQTWLNHLLENQNAADLKGFSNSNFVNLTYSLEELNKILTARSLPIIVPYDKGYIDETGTFQLFIPNGVCIVVGNRQEKIGGFLRTPSLHRQVNGQAAPGYFSIIECNGMPNVGQTIDMGALGQGKNPKIEITGGVYGGTALRFPRSVVKMNVG
jgi:hypothetical protein